jgi:hypothetical protein
MNGLWATGRTALASGRVTYDVYLGNGQRILDGALDMQNEGNADAHTALGTRLGYEFRGGALDTLWIGVHAFQEAVPNFVSGVMTAQTDVRVTGGFLHWTPGDWELIGEYYGFQNHAHDAPGPTYASSAWFAEADYTFLGLITPLVRYERGSFSQLDGYFQYLQGGQSYIRDLIGVRYDLTPQVALKLDANRTNATRNGGQEYDEMHFQVAVRF